MQHAVLLLLACLQLVAGHRLSEPQAPAAAWGTGTYIAQSSSPSSSTGGGLQSTLQLSLGTELLQQYGPSFRDLSVEVTPETASRLRVKVSPTGTQRWQVPQSIVPRAPPSPGLRAADTLYEVAPPVSGQPYALSVLRKSTQQPVFDTRGHRLVFKDQFIELTTAVPADADLYGLGQTMLATGMLLPRDGTVLTLWNRDLPASITGANVYGSHPFVLQVNKDGSSHGVLLLNSNGMDALLNKTSLTFRTIGGLIDLYFFMGPTPEAVIQQYHAVIGTTAMPPYWALGAHQARWGYGSVNVLEQVVANYSAAGLPLECIWADIDYMSSRFQTMTFDEVRFPVPKMRSFVDALHSRGQKWVPIQDAGIAVASGYRAYEEGVRDDVFIKDQGGKTYVGQVWPGPAVYPDYLAAPKVASWLKQQLSMFYQQVPFDGLWLDMNEASNFCSGLNCVQDSTNKTASLWLNMQTPRDNNLTELIIHRTKCQMKCEQPPRSNKLHHPPYSINNWGWIGPTVVRNVTLGHGIISPAAVHADGTREYDAHNLYGTSMAMRHHEAFVQVTGKRPFMILRSTFPGAGRFTGHWAGDNAANWNGLYESVASILNPSMWGIAMVGSDVCGFIDTAPDSGGDPPINKLPDAEYEELCNRWASAGAFYPFSRNHITYFSRPHEFYRWPSVTASARKAYGLRYQLLTYLYGSLFIAHTRGGTLARPLLFADPSDLKARNASRQWMMGEALLVSPVMAYKAVSVEPHFTAGAWYSAWDYARINVTQGTTIELAAQLGDVPVHFRGGAIIPLQAYAQVTRDVRYSPVTLIVTLPGAPSSGEAAPPTGPQPPYGFEETCAAAHRRGTGKLVSCGLLFSDADAVTVSNTSSVEVWFTAVTAADARAGSISSTVKSSAGGAKDRLRIAAVHVVGLPLEAPQGGGSGSAQPRVSVNGATLAAGGKAVYTGTDGVLRIMGLDLPADAAVEIGWALS